MIPAVKAILAHERGAISVDWVVVSAGLVGMTLSAFVLIVLR